MVKRLFFGMSVTGLVFALIFAGCSGTKQPSDSSTVKILSALTGGKDDAEMRLFEQALSADTGLNVVIERLATDYNRILLQKLQAGEKYDLIYMGMDQYLEFTSQGALLDITDMVENSAIFQNNIDPQEIEDIRLDGRIYAGFNKQELHRVVQLNRVMLEAAGIDYKTIEPTLDGYYQAMKQLKAANPAPDFYPFNVLIGEVWDLQPWMAAAGLKNGAVLGSDGKVFASYASDEAAPVWEWFKKLYDEGLLDPASFVDQSSDMRAKMGAASQKTAITADWAMWTGIQNGNAVTAGIGTDEYEIVSLPGVKNPDGNYMLVKGSPSLWGIPANAENPAGAFAVLEYFATQEGGELLSVGIDGYDYNIVNGKYVMTDVGMTHSSDHGAPSPIYRNFIHPVGFNPGVEDALQYLKYATIDFATKNDTDFRRIQGKWYIRIIRGEVGVLEGLASCREELVSLGFVDR